MFGSQSTISQNNYQSISNVMQQISNQQCINSCTAISNINFFAENSTFNDISNITSCQINSSSCILKSALDTQLLNSLASTQSGSITEIEGIFTLLQSLLGDDANITQNNYQSIMNEVTQVVNNTCRTDPTSTDSSNYIFQSDIVEGNVTLGAVAGNTKASCVLQNMSNIYANNSETNSQTASISKIDGLTLIILAIIAAVLVVFMIVGLIFLENPTKAFGALKSLTEKAMV